MEPVLAGVGSLDKEDLGLLAGGASPKVLFREGGGYNLQQRHHACLD